MEDTRLPGFILQNPTAAAEAAAVVVVRKVKQSHYTPWRRWVGEGL
jgi:hypothetical protein